MAVLKDLIVHGNSRFVNGAQFNTINAESIGADSGIFNKLVATTLDAKTATIDDLTAKNATITALLDVQGEMHTNSWSNANIATIDGSFYISPTSSSADGNDIDSSDYTPVGTITYSDGNFTSLVITGTFNTSQLSLDNATSVAWPANSYVIATGDILVGNEWYPIGTIRGKLSSQLAADEDSKTITLIPIGAEIIDGEVGDSSLTDGNGLMPQTLEAIRVASSGSMSGLKMRKVKISMTSYGGSTYQSPIGIFMTAMGSNYKTFLDIYGGSNDTTTIPSDSGALALPTLRIGNLSGLPAVGGITPAGWGIYTSNGFFTGTIVAKQGKIGDGTAAWTIGNDGDTRAYIYSGISNITTSGTTTGIYVGTNGISNYKDTSTYVNIQNGVITAQGADISGEITATSGTIGGCSISNGVLQVASANVTDFSASVVTATKANFTTLSSITANMGTLTSGIITTNSSRTTYDATTAGLTITTSGIGAGNGSANTFYVNTNGYLFSRSGQIGGWYISSNALCSATTYTPASGRILLAPAGVTTSSAVGNLPAATYAITASDSFGVTAAGKLYATGAEINGNIAATNGFSVTQEGITLASLTGSGITLGKTTTGEYNITITPNGGINLNYGTISLNSITSSGMTINNSSGNPLNVIDNEGMVLYDGSGTEDSNILANFGTSILIGKEGSSRILLDADKFTFYDKNKTKYFELNQSATESKTAITDGSHSFTIDEYQSEGSTYTFALTTDEVTAYENGTLDIKFVYSVRTVELLDYYIEETTSAVNLVVFVLLNDSVTDSVTIRYITYTITADSKPYLTFGSRKNSTNPYSVVMGYNCEASGKCSFAEGWTTVATKDAAHAEGYYTTASGKYSHAEGSNTISGGIYSHTQGYYTTANGYCETVIGKYNTITCEYAQTSFNTSNSKYILVAGNGTITGRSNALTLDWDGNLVTAGKINGTLGTFTSGVNISDGQAYKINNVNILELVYPVGAIYISTSSTSPATLFGFGTWTRITGQFLLGATDNGSSGSSILSTASVAAGGSGGEASHTLTSSESGLPAHSHTATILYKSADAASGSAKHHITTATNENSSTSIVTISNNTAADASSAHNNMPPFLAVYMWKRTA